MDSDWVSEVSGLIEIRGWIILACNVAYIIMNEIKDGNDRNIFYI